MKKNFFIIVAAVLLFSCSQKEDFFTESVDGLIDVTIRVGTSDSETKIWSGWENDVNRIFWNQSDSIGLFAGSGNINRRFSLSSAADAPSGSFTGRMAPVLTPTNLIAYYPYSEGTTLDKIPYPDLSHQVFEGTFEEKGVFSNFGQYALLMGGVNNFTIETEWPSEVVVSFVPFVGLVRFGISSELSSSLNVRRIGMISEQYSFVDISSYNILAGRISGYYTNEVSTEISEKNPLVLDGTGTKYVQMASSYSSFTDGEVIEVYVETLSDDGQDIKYTIPKTVSTDNNLAIGLRTSVSVPLTNSTSVTRASRVKVTTSDGVTSLMAPAFSHGANYKAGDAVWGDSCLEKYEAGRTHTFTTTGEHTSSFNHWGESDIVTIDNLTGITAIDFSDVY